MNKKLISLAIAAVLANHSVAMSQSNFSLHQVVDQQGQIISDWVSYNQAMIIQLLIVDSSVTPDADVKEQSKKTQLPSNTSHFLTSNQLEFQIMLGDNDVTSLFDFKNYQLIFSGGIPLPAGEHQLVVSQKKPDGWKQIGSTPLNIMTSTGFKQAEWTTTLEMNVNSQLDEKTYGDSAPSDKPTFSDATASIGLASHHQNDDFTIDSHINLFHVSNREQAIQFGNKLNKATKLDVTDYALNVKKGNHSLTIGHTSYGTNSLLIDNLSRRGVSWKYQNEDDISFSGAILSGSDIVGYNNFLGLSNYSQQYVNSLGFGFNTFKDSRVSLRIEGTYLDAERLSQNDFGIGEVASAETNQGLGFHFVANDSQGKFNADLTIGLSRYNNPNDESLSFGDELVKLDIETSMAHNLNMSYILLQEWETPWGNTANFTLNANHSSAEPLYQTLTAFVQANVENKMIGGQYQIGNVSGNLSSQTSQDNLDRLVNILTTKTENNSFSSSFPLAQMFLNSKNENSTNLWLPNLDYSFQETHQYAINSPNFDESGFNGGSHLPDQLTTNHSLSSSWQLEKYSLSLQSSHNNQDNRQVGRELADFTSLQHSASINIQQSEATSWSLSLGKNRQADLEDNKIQFSKSFTVTYNWQSIDGLGVSVNYGLSKDDDSKNEASNVSTNASIGIVKNLIQGEWFLPFNGSINYRLNYNDTESIDRVFDQASQFGTKTAQLGINLSF